MVKKLTAKENSAIRHYTDPISETYNVWTESCKKARYALCTGWKHNAIRVLHKDYIQQAIADKQAVMEQKIDVTVSELVVKLRKLADLDPVGPKDSIKDLSNIDIKAAIELLGKYKGMFKEVAVNLNANIPTDPAAYRQWLESELKRLQGSERVLLEYDAAVPAIAERY